MTCAPLCSLWWSLVRKRLGRFHGDLGFVGTGVKQEMCLTGVNGLGLMTY